MPGSCSATTTATSRTRRCERKLSRGSGSGCRLARVSDGDALSGKVIVIIGGTTGLGLSAARACAAAGSKVVVVGRDAGAARDAADTLGDAGRVLTADATDAETAPRAIAEAVARFGGFHG